MALNFKNIKDSLKKKFSKDVEVEIIDEQPEDKTEDITLTELETEAKPKPRLKPIQILIVLLLIAFLLMEDEMTGEAPSAPTTPIKTVQKKEPLSPAPKTKEVEPVIKEEIVEMPKSDTETEINIPVVKKPEEVETLEIEETPIAEEVNLEEDLVLEESKPLKDPLKAIEIEEPVELSSEEITNTILEDSSSETDDLLVQIQKELKQEKLLQKDLLDKINDTSPPDYTRSGSALVRNCQGKHWACVDAPSYKKCEVNYNWVKKQSKATQCQPENIYASDADCERAQYKAAREKLSENFCL